jgi:tRNA(Ile)-lysidine synthase
MADRSLSARVADFVARHKLLPRGAVVVVGVSGGADSIALLHGLRALGRDHDHPLRLHVAHLHHGIRGADADADAAFVESLAADLGLPCIRDHVDIPKLHAREPGSREELARRERYRFFERAAARCGADHIAVGHHADDQAETVLHRIVRGTGLRGLAGMAPVRTLRGVEGCRLVRPLLCVTRKEILAYLESGGMAYRTDATNADRDLTRNRIRGELLPELARDYNPRVRAALVRLAEQAGGAYAFIDATAIKTLAAVTVRADAGASGAQRGGVGPQGSHGAGRGHPAGVGPLRLRGATLGFFPSGRGHHADGQRGGRARGVLAVRYHRPADGVATGLLGGGDHPPGLQWTAWCRFACRVRRPPSRGDAR